MGIDEKSVRINLNILDFLLHALGNIIKCYLFLFFN